MKNFTRAFLIQVQFLTRIPLPVKVEYSEEIFAKGVIFAPVIGLIIGLATGGVYYLALSVTHRFIASVVCAVIAEVMITGGLHLDGLADTFDGIFSNRPKEKILEIMKDSRIGTNGTIALVLAITGKIFFLLAFERHGIIGLLFIMPAVSRMNIAWAAGISSCAREGGMAAGIIEHTGVREMIIATALTVIISFFYNIKALFAVAAAIIFTVLFVKYVEKKIGGITGDIIGAVIELSEIVVIVAFLIVKY